ncbi:MAG: Gfo/Idh/MocA family protein [Sphaerochaeta sp.]
MNKSRVGIIGCGNISDVYIKNIQTKFDNLDLIAISNRHIEKAREKAKRYNIKTVMTVEEMLSSSEIDTILILTPPDSHGSLAKKAIDSNKNVYVEKPLSLTDSEAQMLYESAKSKGLKLGVAPDTIYGGAYDTCRNLIKSGILGDIVGAEVTFTSHGPESWHPNPDFYYKKGGGPLLDVGPYDISALVNLIGPVETVMGMSKKTFCQRSKVLSDNSTRTIDVDVDTYQCGMLKFENGAIATLSFIFDVYATEEHTLAIYGTEGTLYPPNPNSFGDAVLFLDKKGKMEKVPLSSNMYLDESRGLGLSRMIDGYDSSKLALHVMKIMSSIVRSSDTGTIVSIK